MLKPGQTTNVIRGISFSTSPSSLWKDSVTTDQTALDSIARWKEMSATQTANSKEMASLLRGQKSLKPLTSVLDSLHNPVVFTSVVGSLIYSSLPMDIRSIAFLLAIGQNESGLNPYSKSSTNISKVTGLFQLTDSNARALVAKVPPGLVNLVGLVDPKVKADWLRISQLRPSQFSLVSESNPLIQSLLVPLYFKNNLKMLPTYATWMSTHGKESGQWKLTGRTVAPWIIKDVHNPALRVIFKDYWAGLTYFMSILHTDGPGAYLGLKPVKVGGKIVNVKTDKPTYPQRALQDVAQYARILKELRNVSDEVQALVLSEVGRRVDGQI